MRQHPLRHFAPLATATLATVLTAGCGTVSSPSMASVSGTATYRERMALPPGAVFEARLEDVSRADAPAELVASTRAESPGAPPFRFTISYDPARIVPTHRYAIQTRVTHGEELLFVSDTHTPLPTGPDAAAVEIMMVRAAARNAASPPDGATSGPAPMRGQYRYMADAGIFTDCASGNPLPVAQVRDNAALESAYLKARPEAGAQLLATVVGRVETRKGMEGPARPTLIVEHFVSIAAAPCDKPAAATLEDSYWELVQLGSEPVKLATDQRAPYLVLASAGHRASGYAGCNGMTGGYTLEGAKLSFTQMASTMMACAQGMELEQAFHAALAKTAKWRLEGSRLVLLDAGGSIVAAFSGADSQ